MTAAPFSGDRRVLRRVDAAVRAAVLGPCALGSPMAMAVADTPPRLLLVAVSGGQDSLALLHALDRVRSGRPVRGFHFAHRLAVAHFDHGLRRSAVRAGERAAVQAAAARLGAPFIAGDGDVRAVAIAEHRSLEDAARHARYRFLGDAAARLGADAVAAGHTATDQAETVLLRLVRGTGVTGLAAMDWRAPWPLGERGGPPLIRPLLGVRREETAAYCRALDLRPADDEENRSPRYTRNRVRAELLPLLERRFNPGIIAALGALADSARAADALVSTAADTAWRTAARHDGVVVTLDRAALRTSPEAVRMRVLARAAERVSGAAPGRSHLAALSALLRDGPRAGIMLPGGVPAMRDGPVLRVGATVPAAPVPLAGAWPIGDDGGRVPGWVVRVGPLTTAGLSPEPLAAWLRPEVLAARRGPTVTCRRPGDRIVLPGLAGAKRVQDLLVDAKVPRDRRDAVPLLRSGGQVAWVVGLRVAAWARADAGAPGRLVEFLPDESRMHVARG